MAGARELVAPSQHFLWGAGWGAFTACIALQLEMKISSPWSIWLSQNVVFPPTCLDSDFLVEGFVEPRPSALVRSSSRSTGLLSMTLILEVVVECLKS